MDGIYLTSTGPGVDDLIRPPSMMNENAAWYSSSYIAVRLGVFNTLFRSVIDHKYVYELVKYTELHSFWVISLNDDLYTSVLLKHGSDEHLPFIIKQHRYHLHVIRIVYATSGVSTYMVQQ
jgi:hypothetical protein